MSLYFLSTDSKNRPVYTQIHQKLHFIKGLKANLLIGNDILATEKIIIDLASKTAMITSYQVTIAVMVKPKSHLVQRKVLVNRTLIILLESEAFVQFVYSELPDNQDFLFNPRLHSHFTLISHILDNSTRGVLVQNESYQPIFLLRHKRLGMFAEILYDNCFQVSLNPDLTEYPPTHSIQQARIKLLTLEPGFEMRLVNEIWVYRDLLAI